MKPNTHVYAAIRSVGDSSDSGQFFDGSLRDAFMWFMQVTGKMYLKKRIQFAIGRTREEASLGIATKSVASQSDSEERMRSLLDSVMGEDFGTDDAPEGTEDNHSTNQPTQTSAQIVERDPRDTYQG